MQVERLESDGLEREGRQIDDAAGVVAALRRQLADSEQQNKNMQAYIESLKQSYVSTFGSPAGTTDEEWVIEAALRSRVLADKEAGGKQSKVNLVQVWRKKYSQVENKSAEPCPELNESVKQREKGWIILFYFFFNTKLPYFSSFQ